MLLIFIILSLSDSTSSHHLSQDIDGLSQGDTTSVLPRIPPELLGYYIRRSSHQPLCLYYEGKGELDDVYVN